MICPRCQGRLFVEPELRFGVPTGQMITTCINCRYEETKPGDVPLRYVRERTGQQGASRRRDWRMTEGYHRD